MDILLITNNYSLINEFDTFIDVENSMIIGLENINKYKYVIIDEDSISIENDSIQNFLPFKDKVFILGYNKYNEFNLIHKNEFYLDNIDIILSENTHSAYQDIEYLTEEEYKEELRAIQYVEDINKQENIEKYLNTLEQENKLFKTITFNLVSPEIKRKIFKLPNHSIKKDLIKHTIGEKINTLKKSINKVKP